MELEFINRDQEWHAPPTEAARHPRRNLSYLIQCVLSPLFSWTRPESRKISVYLNNGTFFKLENATARILKDYKWVFHSRADSKEYKHGSVSK